MRIISFLVLLLLVVTSSSYAKSTSATIPRFVSLKSSEVNSRTGPNMKYPISWVYTKKSEPIEIIAEFEQWKKIKDYNGDKGWVHETMLSNKRYVIIESFGNVYDSPSMTKPVFTLESGVRASLLKCRNKNCEIKIDQYNGWIEKSKLWGIYEKEEYN